MKRILLFVVLMTTLGLSAQENGAIQGYVTDLESFNEPLLMAEIKLNDTQFKTKTNLNGNFELTGIEPGFYTLSLSFLGYETVELPIEVKENNITNIAQGLKAQTLSLGDISAVLSEEVVDPSHVASIEKRNKE